MKQFLKVPRPYDIMKLQKYEKKEEHKIYPDEGHTQTHGSFTETFQQLQMSFLIRRESHAVINK